MAVTNYYTIDGQMIGYKDAGGRKDFLTDALGSVTGEVDQTGTNRTFNGRYKPYGGMLWASGSRGSFGWVGTWGYKSIGLKNSSHYVRARHYSQTSGMWTTQDKLWPQELAYLYLLGRVLFAVDPSGMQVRNPQPQGNAQPANPPLRVWTNPNPPKEVAPLGPHTTQPSPPNRNGNFPNNPPSTGGGPNPDYQKALDGYYMGNGQGFATCKILGQGLANSIDRGLGYMTGPIPAQQAVTSQECRDHWDRYHSGCDKPIPSCQGTGNCANMRREIGAMIRDCMGPRLWVVNHCDFPNYPTGIIRQTGIPWTPDPNKHIGHLCDNVLRRIEKCLAKCPGLKFNSAVLDSTRKLCQTKARMRQ